MRLRQPQKVRVQLALFFAKIHKNTSS